MTWPHPLTHWTTHPHNYPSTHLRRVSLSNHKSSNRIELSWLCQDILNCWWFDLTNPLTHWLTHPWVGVSLQIINLQTELNYLAYVKIYSIVHHLTWPTLWPTQPPTHPPIGVFTNHKSSNTIELSGLCQDLFNCSSFDLTHPLTHPTTHTPTHRCLYKS